MHEEHEVPTTDYPSRESWMVEIRRDVPVFGRGLYATRDFEPGDTVVEEIPFIRFSYGALSWGHDPRNIERRYKLHDVSDEWLQLAACICETFAFALRQGCPDPLDLEEFRDLVAVRGPSTDEQFALLKQILPIVQQTFNNNYNADLLFELYSKIASNAYGSGVYRTISYINHSCHPNVIWKPYQQKKTKTLQSSSKTIACVAPIKQGEQILISYADYEGYDLSLLADLGIRCQNDSSDFERTMKCLCCEGRDPARLRQVFELS